jgi:hypothetical protein
LCVAGAQPALCFPYVSYLLLTHRNTIIRRSPQFVAVVAGERACIENEREKMLKEIAKMGCRTCQMGTERVRRMCVQKGVCGCYAAIRARIHLVCRAANGVSVPLAVV